MNENFNALGTDKEKICGIESDDIIKFCFAEMLGSDAYADLTKVAELSNDPEKTEDAKRFVSLACLKKAWRDAVMHESNKIDNLSDDERKRKRDEALCSCVGLDKPGGSDLLREVMLIYSKDIERQEYVDKLDEIFRGKALDKIKEFKDKFNFGRFQKLFNMALKYYVCVYAFRNELGIKNVLSGYNGLKGAHCPIDSNILDEISKEDKKYSEFTDRKWTQITEPAKYAEIQDAIHDIKSGEQTSNLAYDFKVWEKSR